MIRCENMAKRFPAAGGELAALTDIHLTVEPGEFIVVKGPSGCGKTTLLLALGGMQRPTTGHVWFDETDLYSAFQSSSRSAYSPSSLSICASRSVRRRLEASSDSFFKASRSILSWIKRRSSRSISSGLLSISMRMRDAASSTKSMALSGSWRSLM
jgi:ABC-type multidrug transport system ATPase subunit